MFAPDAESISWIRFALASFTVIGLLALMGWALKMATMRGWLTPQGRISQRLSLKASLPLDARRRIVIVRKDGDDFCLLLGGGNDILLSKEPCRPDEPDLKSLKTDSSQGFTK